MAQRKSIRTVSVLSAFMLFFASCAWAPAGKQWDRSGADEEQVEHAVDNCNARVAFFSLTPIVWSTLVNGRKCMRRQGYRLKPEVTSP